MNEPVLVELPVLAGAWSSMVEVFPPSPVWLHQLGEDWISHSVNVPLMVRYAVEPAGSKVTLVGLMLTAVAVD
jgi:hypothetical protein